MSLIKWLDLKFYMHIGITSPSDYGEQYFFGKWSKRPLTTLALLYLRYSRHSGQWSLWSLTKSKRHRVALILVGVQSEHPPPFWFSWWAKRKHRQTSAMSAGILLCTFYGCASPWQKRFLSLKGKFRQLLSPLSRPIPSCSCARSVIAYAYNGHDRVFRIRWVRSPIFTERFQIWNRLSPRHGSHRCYGKPLPDIRYPLDGLYSIVPHFTRARAGFCGRAFYLSIYTPTWECKIIPDF